MIVPPVGGIRTVEINKFAEFQRKLLSKSNFPFKSSACFGLEVLPMLEVVVAAGLDRCSR
jgi:hypothetical protein